MEIKHFFILYSMFIIIWQCVRHFNSHLKLKVSALMTTRAGQKYQFTLKTKTDWT